MAKIIKINQYKPNNETKAPDEKKEFAVSLHCAKSEKIVEITACNEQELEKKIQDELIKNGWYIGICWVERINEDLPE